MTARSKNAINQELLSFQDVRVEEYKKLRPRAEGDVVAGAELLHKMETEETPLSALCISGGGIRSATFALGAIQGLADKGILSSFDYLSTVSGGGYIGSWLTAWKHRRGGLEKILPELKTSVTSAQQGAPEAIQHLREFNNYLSPKIGLFSADTWTLVATVVRNMLLNWLVLVPLMMAALMAPRLVLALTEFGLQQGAIYCGTSVDQRVDLALSFLAGALLAVAIFNTLRYFPSVGNKNHLQSDYLKYVFLPLVASVLAFV